jgi:hypothetical protein
LDQDFRTGGFLTSVPAALRAAREIASARATAHCGWTPVREYDALPHTGQSVLVAVMRIGIGFVSLMIRISRSGTRRATRLAVASSRVGKRKRHKGTLDISTTRRPFSAVLEVATAPARPYDALRRLDLCSSDL